MMPGGQTIDAQFRRMPDGGANPIAAGDPPEAGDETEAAGAPGRKGLSKEEQAEIIKRANKHWEYGHKADDENRKQALKDTKFVFIPLNQWEQDTRDNERKNRICLEINQLPQFINQVVNELRQQRAGIRISPESGEANVAEAKRRQGIIRGIEKDCRADQVYDAGATDAVVGGRGYWRVVTDWANDRSFDQKIAIRPIADFLSVLLDPDYQEPDGSDRKWGFVSEVMEKEAFLSEYPDCEPIDWDSGTRGLAGWFEGADKIIVADYYERTAAKRDLILRSDGATYYEGDPPPPDPTGFAYEVRRRATDVWRVRWFKLAGGQQVLEEFEWRGTIIPVICCVGNEKMVEGKRHFWGLTRFARDPQMMYNFAQSTIAETAALSPKSPFMATEGQVEGYEAMYDVANRKNLPVMYYNPKSHEGNLLPPPQRQQPAQVPGALVEIANTARQDLRSTIGIYDSSLGQRSNETSGRAILAREQQGDVATFNFPDNQARAIALTGRIVDELLPFHYDNQREVRQVEEDGKETFETINRNVGPGAPPADAISKDAKFTATVEAGPSYGTKRQESRESMMAFVQANPAAGAVLGDLIAKDMDWENADVVAERLEALLPPQIQQQIAAKRQQKPGAPPPDPAMLAQLQAKDQQLQQLTQQLQEFQAALQQAQAGDAEKAAKVQADAATAQAQAAAKAQQAIETARADAETAETVARIRAESDERIAIARAEIDQRTKITIAGMQPAKVPGVPGVEGGEAGEAQEDSAEQSIQGATLQVLAGLTETMARLGEVMGAPREIVYNAEGRPAASRVVIN